MKEEKIKRLEENGWQAGTVSDFLLRKLTQTQASALLGMPQPKLSNMLRGRFRGISESKMLECLTLLGRDIQIVVKTASRSASLREKRLSWSAV